MKEILLKRRPVYVEELNTIEWEGEKLSLKNDGQLEIVFIGVGSAFAKTMYQNNMIIIKGDSHLLVDFGATGPMALNATCGLDMNDIEAVFPTHSHSDHVGGIEALGQMNMYVGRKFMNKPKLKMLISEEYQRILWDYTLRGGLEYNEEIVKGKKMQFNDYYEVIRPQWKSFTPREMFTLDFNLHGTGKPEDTIKLEIFRTIHIPEQVNTWEASFVSYGLFIDNRVLFTADTKLDLDLIEMYGEKAEAIFHDLQFFPGAVHAPIADYQAKVQNHIKRKTRPMHIADSWRTIDISDLAGWTKQGCRYIF